MVARNRCSGGLKIVVHQSRGLWRGATLTVTRGTKQGSGAPAEARLPQGWPLTAVDHRGCFGPEHWN